MLSRLCVKNVALISEADVEFCDKLNVLSGETGSGKSVILDSINFVLGSKADKTMIRYGESQAIVKAEFNVDPKSEAVKILSDYDIESDGEIIITRKFGADGKGSIKINGNTVTAAMLKNVTQHLVDVHGQSEHFFLLSEDNQLKVLDELAGDEVNDKKAEIAKLIALKREIKSKIAVFGGDEAERERKLDLLKYQIDEIEKAELRVGEYDELKEKQNLILNVEKIISVFNEVKSVLDDENGCIDSLSSALHGVNSISSISESYADLALRLENLRDEASDISETISDLYDEISFDEAEAQRVGDRIEELKRLFKKYGGGEREALDFLQKANSEYAVISEGAAAIEKYNSELAECDDKIYSQCRELTEIRQNTAEKFCRGVVEELKTLNIPDAQFSVAFESYDKNSANLNSAEGSDKICFNFSANKGEPQKPLSKVISGGEMSRFMLAIKARLKDINGISTYIFDEIDAGISGYTAATVANKFINIAKDTQIIAVSHLPQICAASDMQYLIYKTEENGKTLTKVKNLSQEEKVLEIIRLTGSVDSQAAREHAEELIKQYKK